MIHRESLPHVSKSQGGRRSTACTIIVTTSALLVDCETEGADCCRYDAGQIYSSTLFDPVYDSKGNVLYRVATKTQCAQFESIDLCCPHAVLYSSTWHHVMCVLGHAPPRGTQCLGCYYTLPPLPVLYQLPTVVGDHDAADVA